MAALTAGSIGLIGHQWVLDFFKRCLASGRVGHACLLTGPPHVGKFTTALAMARLLLCPEGRACGACRHCRLAERQAHPDLRVLEIPSDRRNIPLRDVHEFMQGMALKPLESARKVYVIRGAEDLAEEGANALLKTIEEPPPAVTIVLTSPSPALLLPTVVSRCQIIGLRRVSSEEIAAHLVQAYEIDADRARAIARASKGSPGWAILAAENPSLVEDRHQRATDLLHLLEAGRLERIRYADGLAERWSAHGDDVREGLETWTDVWRGVLLVQENLEDRVGNVDLSEQIQRAASRLERGAVRAALATTVATAGALERNANPRLALESYTLLLPRLEKAR